MTKGGYAEKEGCMGEEGHKPGHARIAWCVGPGLAIELMVM